MTMTTNIRQFLHCDKRGSLTNLYLELGLPLRAALQTAEADLWQFEPSDERGELGRVSLASRAVSGGILLQELVDTLSKIEPAFSSKL
jgi:hypothetical protein